MRPPRGRGTFSAGRGAPGRGGKGGKGGKGGGKGREPEGPPEYVEVLGKFMHSCEGELVCRVSHASAVVPYFNASIFLDKENKIGKVDEVFGPTTQVMFTVKPDTGINADSFNVDDEVMVDPSKLLPVSRFTNEGGGGGGGKGGGKGGKGKGGKGGKGGGKGGKGRGSPGGKGKGGGRGGIGRGRGRGF